MNKKTILFIACLIISILGKAQLANSQKSSELLTEEKITQILNQSRKEGVQEWEIKKANLALHKRLKEQTNLGINNKGIISPPQVNSSGCINSGFESGSTTGWELYSGNINQINLPCNTCATTNSGAISSIVNATTTVTGQCTSGIDTYGNFPVVAPSPYGGVYSLLLNNAASGGKMMRASYTFIVDSSVNIFTLQYAAVLQSGGHPVNEQPYFHVDVTNVTTNSVIPCTEYDITAPTSGAAFGWFTSSVDNNVSYRPWTTINLDLQSVMGQTVTVNLVISDCNQGGHFGYCYLDAACGNTNYNNMITFPGLCDTSGSATIVAPAGYVTYQWYGPNDTNVIAGANTQTLTTNATANDTFSVKCTSAAGCLAGFSYIMQSSSVNVYSSTDTVNAGSAVVLSATGAITYTWVSSDGGSYSGSSITVYPMANTTYTVTGSDLNGCTDSASMRIYVINQISTGITKNAVINDLQVYPNPANQSITIDCKLKNAQLTLYDVLGNKIKQLVLENETTVLDINSLDKGVYFLDIQTTDRTITKKIVVQR